MAVRARGGLRKTFHDMSKGGNLQRRDLPVAERKSVNLELIPTCFRTTYNDISLVEGHWIGNGRRGRISLGSAIVPQNSRVQTYNEF
jgi:hypothetical protein